MSDPVKSLEAKNKGNKAFSDKNFEEAVKHFTEAIQYDETNHILYSNRSACYAALDKYKEALVDAQKTVQLKPDWSKGYLREGNALFGLLKYKETAEACEKGLKLEPNNEQLKSLLEDAKMYENRPAGGTGNPMASLFSAENILKLRMNPKTAGLLNQPDFMRMIQEIQVNPDKLNQYIQDPRIMQAFGVILGIPEATGESEERSTTSPPPRQPEPVKKPQEQPKKPEPVPMTESQKERDLGNKYYKEKQFELAIQHYDKAVELDSSDILAMNNKAAVFVELNKLDEAIQICKQALEKAMETKADYKIKSKVYTRIGNIYLKQENVIEAYKAYNNAVLEDKNPETSANMQKIEKLKRQYDEKMYQDPQKSLEAKEQGIKLFKEGQYPEAIKAFEEAIKRNPLDHTIYSNRSASYQKLGEYPYAVKDAEKCIELCPSFIKGYIRKGSALFSMREYQKALVAYDQGLHFEPNNAELLELSRKAVQTLNQQQANLTDEERLEQAAKDPEVQEILSDPVMNQILKDMQSNPAAIQNHLKNPSVARKFQKLVDAGIVKVGR
ncbi:tetratricopeptide-like helical domain-containing protein (TPR) [Tieghemostelium lacteum]|uniref:Tetratricopeptide-like helical domain-containing protein (TPR) n=1 Tax=Tieghemostelium lacteum TaxID=361077 RepID=A0A151ZEH6_TIELA|nr:tetratricopeptide-like helical domain-containing protein (TPR) [Tieghemostelium lacteum]|eukprot:KYQ92351.1 tetratricopeptide-like helical domain-containing protein (TPR) [Tieghemostelium lacteum]